MPPTGAGYRGRHVAKTVHGQQLSPRTSRPASTRCYQHQLQAPHLFDLEGRLWYARDLLAACRRRPFESVRAVFVDGSTDFTRTQAEILAGLCEWVDELWVSRCPGEEGDERAELFARPRAVVERFAACAARRVYRDPPGSRRHPPASPTSSAALPPPADPSSARRRRRPAADRGAGHARRGAPGGARGQVAAPAGHRPPTTCC